MQLGGERFLEKDPAVKKARQSDGDQGRLGREATS